MSRDEQGEWDEHVDDAHLLALRIKEAAEAVQGFADSYLAVDALDTSSAERAKLREAERHIQAALDCGCEPSRGG